MIGEIIIDDNKDIGSGGNGTVYSGKINDTPIAIKFLVNLDETKSNRFKAEYINTKFYSDKLIGIVNYLHYDLVIIEDSNSNTVEIPYIVMKKYNCNLKFYRNNHEIEWNDVKKLFTQLFYSIQSMENAV